jgi:hypothetical protein
VDGKAESAINGLEGGITIDFNPLDQNAEFSIRSNLEPLSKITDSGD